MPPTKDLLTEIVLKRSQFTKSEIKVADFITTQPEQALYMSISDLADAVGVGDTTVFRFCRTLKLGGYQEFRMLLAQSISKGLTDNAFVGEIAQGDAIQDIASKLLASNIAALNDTFNLLNYTAIHETVQLMHNARSILFFGAGSSGVSAMEAASKFIRILPNVVCYPDSHTYAMKASLMHEQDLAVAISYSGSTKDVIEALALAKKGNCPTVCITRYSKSPITNHADIVLSCASNEGPFQGGSLSAKVSQLFILDILFAEYFKAYYDDSKNNKEKTTGAISQKLL